VESGKRKWPLHFSGLFEATCVSGLSLGKADVVMAISCRGVFLLDEPYQVLAGLHYYELVDAIFIRLVRTCQLYSTVVAVDTFAVACTPHMHVVFSMFETTHMVVVVV